MEDANQEHDAAPSFEEDVEGIVILIYIFLTQYTETAMLRWKKKLSETATTAVQRVTQLSDIIYGKLRDRSGTTRYDDDVDQPDSSKFVPETDEVRDFKDEEV